MQYNSLGDVNGEEFHRLPYQGEVHWTSSDLKRIVRIRYLTDPGYPSWDLSYCYGLNQSDQKVRITGLPYQLQRGIPMVNQLVEAAKKDGVYLKGLCGGNINDVLSYMN